MLRSGLYTGGVIETTFQEETETDLFGNRLTAAAYGFN